MHFVAALDSVPEMRAVLALFEGVATGAADGYARMAGTPAATLLHLGPGLGNGLANLHNARRARVPIVNIVGDHATYHTQYDAPLQSDIETVARNVSTWVRTSRSTAELARDAVEAVSAAIGPPGQVATLILPADVSWSDGAEPAGPPAPPCPAPAPPDVVESVAAALRRRAGPRSCSAGGRCASADCSPPRGSRPPRREALRRGVSDPPRARRRAARRRADRVRTRARDGPAQGTAAPDPRRRQGSGVVLRLPGQEELPGAGRLRGARARGPGRRRAGEPRGAGRGPRRPDRDARAAAAVRGPRSRPAR